jgi:hypothetical protein
MRTKVKGFEVYTLYVAMKAHFKTKSYDFVKFGGKIRSRISTYNNRKDKYYFEKLAKKYSESEIKDIVENEDIWIGDTFDSDAEETWKKWRSKKDSLERVFNSEFNSICEFAEENNMKFDEFFQSNDGDHPEILKWYLRKDVSVETFLILDSLLSFVLRLNCDLKDDVVWNEHSQRIKKYRSFFTIDTKRFRKKALDILKKYEIQK